jgi:uncharacterized protein
MPRPAIIDVVVPMTPAGSVNPAELSERMRTPSVINQLTVGELLARMDSFGIGQSIIPARRYGPGFHLDYAKVRDFVAGNPKRLFATAGVDPLDRMDGVRALEEAVRDWGFIGAHTYSSWSGVPADHRLYYPYYAKCEELGVPFQVECMNSRGMVSRGHPRYLEQVATDFPGLKLVAMHTGYPWERELVAVAEFRANVYIGCDTLPPKLWSADLLAFIKGETYASLAPPGMSRERLRQIRKPTTERCLFGSNYLSINLETDLPAIDEFGFDDETWARLMADNARALYQLPDFEFAG